MSKDPDEPLRRVEVITSVQRRRRWSVSEKLRLVEEAMQPGMSVSYVARRATGAEAGRVGPGSDRDPFAGSQAAKAGM